VTIPDRLPSDDRLNHVNRHWLGPHGWTFPWQRARFSAYFPVGVTVALIVALVETRLGIRVLSIAGAAICGLITWRITRRIMGLVTHEVLLRHLAKQVWHEIRSPRERTAKSDTLNLPRTKAD